MNDSGKPCCTNLKAVLWTLVIFALFGFLALILSGRLETKNPENRAFQGEFTKETTQQRWANLAEVAEAQSALVDETKLAAALASIAKSPEKPAATELVVPGSPTFLKQMEQSAAPKAEAPKAEAPKAEAPKAEAPKAEAPKAEAPKAEAPKAEAPKAEAPKAEAPKAEAPKAEAPKAEAPKAEAPAPAQN